MKAEPIRLSAAAFAFDGGEFKTAAPADDGRVRVDLLARSSRPVENAAFMREGDDRVPRVVHDNASAIIPPRIALDWAHDKMPVGVADKSWLDDAKNLFLSGELIPDGGDEKHDRARQIQRWTDHGVPLEASVFWDSDPEGKTRIEWHEKPVEVNGKRWEASKASPLVVVRNWVLKSCAICQHGRDPYTGIHLYAQPDGGPGATRTVMISLPKEYSMSEATNDAGAGDAATEDTLAVPEELQELIKGWSALSDEVKSAVLAAFKAVETAAEEASGESEADAGDGDSRKEFKALVKEFGHAAAAEYFEAGLDANAARVRHCKRLADEKRKLAEDLEKTKKELTDTRRESGVRTRYSDAGGGQAPAKAPASPIGLGAGGARYAANMKV